jgi:hypothetical protein
VTLQECGKSEQALECVKAAYDISSQECNLREKLEDVSRLASYYAHVGRDAEAIECFDMYFSVRMNERRALGSPLLDEQHEAHYYLTYALCLIADKKYSLAMGALRKSKSLDMSEMHHAFWCIIMASWHVGNRNIQDARAYMAKAYAHELTDGEVIQKRDEVQQRLDRLAVQREKEAVEAGESLLNQIAVEGGGGTGVKGCKKNRRKKRSGDAKASIAAPDAEASTAAPGAEVVVKERTEGGQERKFQEKADDMAQSECCVCLDEATPDVFALLVPPDDDFASGIQVGIHGVLSSQGDLGQRWKTLNIDRRSAGCIDGIYRRRCGLRYFRVCRYMFRRTS